MRSIRVKVLEWRDRSEEYHLNFLINFKFWIFLNFSIAFSSGLPNRELNLVTRSWFNWTNLNLNGITWTGEPGNFKSISNWNHLIRIGLTTKLRFAFKLFDWLPKKLLVQESWRFLSEVLIQKFRRFLMFVTLWRPSRFEIRFEHSGSSCPRAG